MNPQKPGKELSDTDIQQCRADILRAVQQTFPKETPKVSPQNQQAKQPLVLPEISKSDPLPSQTNNVTTPENPPAAVQNITEQPALENQFKDMSQQLVAREAQVKAFSAKIRETQDMIVTLRGELKTAQNSLLTEQKEKQTLQTNLRLLEEKLSAKEKDLSSASDKDSGLQETISSLREEVEDLQDNLQIAGQAIKEKQLTIDHLSETLQQQKQSAQLKDSLENKNTQLQSQLELLQEQNKQLQEKLKQNENALIESHQYTQDARSQVEQKQAQLLEINLRLDSLKEENQRLLAEMESRKQQDQQRWQQAQNALTDSNQAAQALQNQFEQKQERISQLEQTLKQSQEESIQLSQQQESLRQNASQADRLLEQKQAEIIELRSQLASLQKENQTLFDETESHKQQINALQEQLGQKEASFARHTDIVQARIKELDQQTQELSVKARQETSELQTLLQDYKTRLEKAERQNRENENRLASIGAYNDRLLAGQSEMEQLQEQIQQLRQQNDLLKRQLERLKGDHQLVGEENNQLHHMLRLRDQELERLRLQTEDLKKTEVSISSEEMEMLRSFEDNTAPTDASETQEPAASAPQPQSEIPSFNLAEQIMAEHRRTVSSQRQAPVVQSKPAKKDSVEQVVTHFVSSSQPTPTVPEETAAHADQTSEAMVWPAAQHDMESTTGDGLIADIVRRDITQFLEERKLAFQRTDWAWKRS